MSNLKQLGLGVMQYVQDYDERYPMCYDLRDGDGVDWQVFTEPYVKSTQVFRCPSSMSKKNAHTPGHYGANRSVLADGDVTTPDIRSMAAIISPASIYMILDAGSIRIISTNATGPRGKYLQYIPGTGPGSPDDLESVNEWASGSPELKEDFASGRHFGGVNMAFADGHVKWLKSQLLVQEARRCGSGPCAWSSTKDNS